MPSDVAFDINSPGIDLECEGCGNIFRLAEIPCELLCGDCSREHPEE